MNKNLELKGILFNYFQIKTSSLILKGWISFDYDFENVYDVI